MHCRLIAQAYTAMPGYTELTRTLDGLAIGISASDLHGSLSGLISGGARPTPANWLAALELDELADAVAAGADRAPFDALLAETGAALDDPECGFALLLPEPEASLAERSSALVEWCRGFLGGLGLAGPDLDRRLSEAGREMIADLARIAASRFDDDASEEAEEAYAEVVEYVRVGVMLLHNELRGQATGARHH